MQNIFRIIKRKKYWRVLTVICFLVVAAELFAHTLKPASNSSETDVLSASAQALVNQGCRAEFSKNFLISCDPDNHNHHQHKTFCQDEVLHHLFLSTTFDFPIFEILPEREKISNQTETYSSKSLPPPYHPPKFS